MSNTKLKNIFDLYFKINFMQGNLWNSNIPDFILLQFIQFDFLCNFSQL